jgi:CTP-dependent riboflavin kinase
LKPNRRSLFELDENPLIKMMLQDSSRDALCDSSDAAREFCSSQKSNKRTISELDKNPLIEMMLQDSRCNISGFLSYGDRIVEGFWADVFIDLCSSIPPVST